MALAVLFGLLLFGKYLWGPIGFNFTYSEGYRVGQVVKVSNKGLIWKTWEASMGITQSGAYVGEWQFSVDSKDSREEELVQALLDAYNNGGLVRVRYMQRAGILPWRGKTTYFMQEIIK